MGRRTAWCLVALALLAALPGALRPAPACAHDGGGGCGPGDGPVAAVRSTGSHPEGPVLEATTLLGGTDPGALSADVVAHDGIAYLASWGRGSGACPSQGVRALSLDDLSAPRLVATFADAAGEPDLAGTWTEKVVVVDAATPAFTGAVAVVSVQACGAGRPFRGFALYDVTDPARPSRLALVPLGANGSHEIWADVVDGGSGRVVHVHTAVILSEADTSVGGAPGEPDYQIWEAADPRAPHRVGAWGAWAELGVLPRDGDRRHYVHSVRVDGDRALLSYWDLGTVLLDVSDRSAPRYLGRTTFEPGQEGNAHSAVPFGGGRYVLETLEDFAPTAAGGTEQAWGYARVVDVADPAAPRVLATVELPSTRAVPSRAPGAWSAHDPEVVGTTAFVSWYAEGVVVLDLADPAAPRVVGRFAPPPSTDPYGVFPLGDPGGHSPQVWGIEPVSDARGSYLLASDVTSGLWVLQHDADVRPATDRRAGADRVATALAVAGGDLGTVVLARADAYADALSGGPLAVELGAPLLLTGSDGLDPRVAERLAAEGTRRAVLLGGEAALGPQVAADLAGLGVEVERLAGPDRFSTAAEVAARLPETATAVVVEGASPDPARGWPDAVSGGADAARRGVPVLLTTRDVLPAATADALRGRSRVTVVGGEAAVGPDVVEAVRGLGARVERIAGADRYETAARVAERALADGADPSRVWLATGAAFPDALAAGPAAASAGQVLVLSPPDAPPAPLRPVLAALRGSSEGLVLVGGEAALSEAVRAAVVRSLNPLLGPLPPAH